MLFLVFHYIISFYPLAPKLAGVFGVGFRRNDKSQQDRNNFMRCPTPYIFWRGRVGYLRLFVRSTAASDYILYETNRCKCDHQVYIHNSSLWYHTDERNQAGSANLAAVPTSVELRPATLSLQSYNRFSATR